MEGPSVTVAAESSQKEPNLNLVCHLICSSFISLNQLRRQFKNQVLDFRDKWYKKPYSHLRCTARSFMGVTFWEPESTFDLLKHITRFSVDEFVLPSPRRVEDVVKISGQLVVKSYAEGTSPWELLLLQNVITNEGALASVIILRIHHVLLDNLGAIRLIHRLFGISAPTTNPQLLGTEQYFKNSNIAPYDLAPFTIDSDYKLDAWTRPGSGGDYVTLCNEQVVWANVKRVMQKYGVGCHAVVHSITAGLVLKLMKEVEKNLPKIIDTSGMDPSPHRPGHHCNPFWTQNSICQAALALGAAVSRFLGWEIKPGNVVNLPLHIPRVSRIHLQSLLPFRLFKGTVKVKSTLAFSHFPGTLKGRSAAGLGRLLGIIPCYGVGHTGSLAVLVSTAGRLRILLSVDASTFAGLSVNFVSYVKRGLQELLAHG